MIGQVHRDTKKNYQLYGRNDMIMLDEHNKIYGSLGMAEPYIVATKEGETLLLDGAKDDEPFIGLSLYGKSHQNTVVGNQLLDVDTMVYNGAFSDSSINDIANARTAVIPIQSGVEYSISRGNLQGDFFRTVQSSYSGDITKLSDITVDTFIDGTFNATSADSERTMIASDNAKYLLVYFWSNSSQYTLDDILNVLMMNIGSTALPWEPYTGGQPSPNPDYPQEIESVGDDGGIGVDVYGGNFLIDVTDKVISGDVGDSVNDVRAIWNVILDKNLLDKELIFSFDSDSNIGRDFLCQIYVIVGNSNKWSGETCKQIAKGRNYFSIAKVFDELPEGNVTHVHVQLRINKVPTEELQFTVSNPMLNIGSTALPFESYKQPQSLIVSTPNGLPGIPVSSGGNYTDKNGQQWVSDEVDYRRRKYVQRVAWATFDGSEKWNQDGGTSDEGLSYYYYKIPGTMIIGVKNGMCSHASWSRKQRGMTWREGFYTNAGNGSFEVRTDMTLDEWKSYLSGMAESGNPVKVVLALGLPTETDLTPEQITAYQSLHTNYPTTTVMNDSDAGMKAIYKQIENGG